MTMDGTSLDMLSGILWRERDVLEHVLDVGGSDAWATDLALRTLSSLELHRAILTREVVTEHRISGEPSLPDLIGGVPPEWAAVLAGHRRALRSLTSDVDSVLGGVVLREDLGALGGEPGDRSVRTRPAVQRSLVEFLG